MSAGTSLKVVNVGENVLISVQAINFARWKFPSQNIDWCIILLSPLKVCLLSIVWLLQSSFPVARDSTGEHPAETAPAGGSDWLAAHHQGQAEDPRPQSQLSVRPGPPQAGSDNERHRGAQPQSDPADGHPGEGAVQSDGGENQDRNTKDQWGRSFVCSSQHPCRCLDEGIGWAFYVSFQFTNACRWRT